MSSQYDGHLRVGSEGVDCAQATVGDADLVREGRYQQTPRREVSVGICSRKLGREQGGDVGACGGVPDTGRGDSVDTRSGPCHQHGGGCGGIYAGAIVDILYRESLRYDAVEAVRPEIGAEQVDIVGGEPLHKNPHHQLGAGGGCLGA